MMNSQKNKLKLYNTLTKTKEVFVPSPNGVVSWYCCGPTVYDKSHIGHARTYVAFDVLRRVLRDYFKYNVLYVMNITDIDDKIIKGARYEKLFEEFVFNSAKLSANDLIKKATDAVEFYKKHKLQPLFTTTSYDDSFESRWARFLKPGVDQGAAGLEVAIMYKSLASITSAKPHLKETGKLPEDFLEKIKPVICPWLDSQHGNTIIGNDTFSAFAKKWEIDYMEDMKALNVEPPDVLTRVSEYVPEIVEFIKVLVQKKYGYVSNGSVYFDIENFNATPGFEYARLEPQSHNDSNLIAQGEGELHQALDKKKSPGDFVLWKKSKPGEPSWDSPWGRGRPGWHIECSVMASDVAGTTLDIHSGGKDLCFPHHDNELAQSEAYHGKPNWVRYFLHSGHLNIGGLKMSKSLKNFITIQTVLKTVTPSRLRIMFLLTHWSQTFDYKTERLNEAKFFESLINNFLVKCAAISSSGRPFTAVGAKPTKFKRKELNLLGALCRKKEQVDAALCDNINTPAVMTIIRELVELANAYISTYEPSGTRPNQDILKMVSSYINSIMTLFGVSDSASFSGEDPAESTSETTFKCITNFSEFRDKIRKLSKIRADHRVMLQECDNVRDNVFHEFGIQLDDSESGPALVKFVGKAAALEARNERIKRDNELQREKQLKKEYERKRVSEKNAKAAIKPSELFKTGEYAGKFSEYDASGIPMKDASGNPLSKSQRKKYEKTYTIHGHLHKSYMDRLSEGSTRENGV